MLGLRVVVFWFFFPQLSALLAGLGQGVTSEGAFELVSGLILSTLVPGGCSYVPPLPPAVPGSQGLCLFGELFAHAGKPCACS